MASTNEEGLLVSDLTNWSGTPRPQRIVLEGRYSRLEPLDPLRHRDDLYASALEESAEDRFLYLFDRTPESADAFVSWIEKASASSDPLFFAVVDKATGRAEGRQSLMRVDTTHGVIEIGNILWGPAIARTRVATEALYLFASYAFDTLGYRRLEWKCDNRNEPSKRAAARFGFRFEGIFQQHMVVKGRSRDTAWFAMTDAQWPVVSAMFQSWLDPSNFDAEGRQQRRLEDFRSVPDDHHPGCA